MSADCPKCNGTGFEIHEGENGVLTSARCACSLDELGSRLLRGARIPRRYDHCTLDSFEIHHDSHREALKAATEWVELWPATRQGLLLYGPPGTGKTHIVVALARELIRQKNARIVFFEQRDLLKKLQASFEADAPIRESEILGRVQEAEVLILDDLGAGRTTAWARDVMHDVIAHRYNQDLPLIMTTNLKIESDSAGARRESTRAQTSAALTLRDRLGDALLSRLHEMCRLVPLQGRDYRSEVAKHRI